MKTILTTLSIFAFLNVFSQNVNIPDANFKTALVSNQQININQDAEIQVSEATAYTGDINLNGYTITNLTGLESFTSATALYGGNIGITTLDISANQALEDVQVDGNFFGSIDISTNPNLKTFSCANCNLTSINTSANVALEQLNIAANMISSIDVSTNVNLIGLSIGYNNSISSLNINNLSDLEFLNISSTQINTIDLSQNPLLNYIEADYCPIATLDFSNNPLMEQIVAQYGYTLSSINLTGLNNLTTLRVSEGLLTNINLGSSPNLYYLDLSYNNLTSIDLSNNTQLDYVGIAYNSLSSLDISSNTILKYLYVRGNQLSSIDLSNNPELEELWISNNNLTTLDLSINTELNSVYAGYNSISTITFPPIIYYLYYLDISDNPISSVDISGMPSILDFYATNCQLTSLNTYNNPALEGFFVSNNQITELDMSQNPNLAVFEADNNLLTELNMRSGNSTFIGTFKADNNPSLTCIQVDDVTHSTTFWTQIDAGATFNTMCPYCTVYIPDANFKTALIANSSINTNSDTEIQCTEAVATISLSLSSLNISDLTGINDFTNLLSLVVDDNSLTELDVTALQQLEYLNCFDNQIADLQLNNPMLSTLSASYNYLSNVDFSSCTSLSNLSIAYNDLSSIDLSSNTSLTSLDIANNLIPTLDLSNNTLLNTAYVDNNLISSIDITGLNVLSMLYTNNNQLPSIDITTNTALTTLGLDNNDLTSLDVSGLTSLNMLSVTGNQLNSLNVANGNNSNMTGMYATGNSSLNCIQVDNVAFSNANWSANIDAQTFFSVDCANGIETELANEFGFYPNPSNDVIQFENIHNGQFEIFNSIGQVVLKGDANESTMINISSLKTGFYSIRLIEGNSSVSLTLIKN